MAYADCNDGVVYCANGTPISYPKCSQGAFWSCVPCNGASIPDVNNDAKCITPGISWMRSDVQGRTLMDITLPAAHDAGIGKTSGCSAGANSENAQTQYKTTFGMLNDGIRLFDIRPTMRDGGGTMYAGHYGNTDSILGYQGCVGYTIDQIVTDVQKFVSDPAYSNEVIILKFSHFHNFSRGDNAFGSADYDSLVQLITTKLRNNLLYYQNNLLYKTIGILTSDGAKVLVTFDKPVDDSTNGSNGIYAETLFNFYDDYYNGDDIASMRIDQLTKLFTEVQKLNPPYFHINWTLTQTDSEATTCGVFGSLCAHSIETLANIANNNLNLFLPAIDYNLGNVIPIPSNTVFRAYFPNVFYTNFSNNNTTNFVRYINSQRPSRAGTYSCQELSDKFGMVSGVTWGLTPQDLQMGPGNAACTTKPTCQGLSDNFGMISGVTWGTVPAALQKIWNDNIGTGCETTPSCQVLSDTYGTSAWITWGSAPVAAQQV